MQDTLRGSAGSGHSSTRRGSLRSSMRRRSRMLDFGRPVVIDQVLTLALSFVFMHEGFRMSA